MSNPLQLQLAVVGSGALVHTIRSSTGWTAFGDVKAQIGNPGIITAVADANVNGDFHLAGVTDTGSVFYTIRSSANGTWLPYEDVKAQIGDPGHVTVVSAAGINGDFHLVLVTDSGGVFHTIRSANGSWQHFGDVKSETGDPGHVTAVAAAAVNGDLQLALSTDTGDLFHTIRFTAANDWQEAREVKGTTGNPGKVTSVGAAGVNGDFHLAVSTDTGGLFHTIRFSVANNWQDFRDVKNDIGDPGRVTNVSGANVGDPTNPDSGDLHLVLVTNDGGLYHTIRFTVASDWQKFGDIQLQTGGKRLLPTFSTSGGSGV